MRHIQKYKEYFQSAFRKQKSAKKTNCRVDNTEKILFPTKIELWSRSRRKLEETVRNDRVREITGVRLS